MASRISFNDAKTGENYCGDGKNSNDSNLAYYQKFNLNTDAEKHIRCLDKLNKEGIRHYYKLETR